MKQQPKFYIVNNEWGKPLETLAHDLVWLLSPGQDPEYYFKHNLTQKDVWEFRDKLWDSVDHESLRNAIFSAQNSVEPPEREDGKRLDSFEDATVIQAWKVDEQAAVIRAKIAWLKQRMAVALGFAQLVEGDCDKKNNLLSCYEALEFCGPNECGRHPQGKFQPTTEDSK